LGVLVGLNNPFQKKGQIIISQEVITLGEIIKSGSLTFSEEEYRNLKSLLLRSELEYLVSCEKKIALDRIIRR